MLGWKEQGSVELAGGLLQAHQRHGRQRHFVIFVQFLVIVVLLSWLVFPLLNLSLLNLRKTYNDPHKYRYVTVGYRGQMPQPVCTHGPRKSKITKHAPRPCARHGHQHRPPQIITGSQHNQTLSSLGPREPITKALQRPVVDTCPKERDEPPLIAHRQGRTLSILSLGLGPPCHCKTQSFLSILETECSHSPCLGQSREEWMPSGAPTG